MSEDTHLTRLREAAAQVDVIEAAGRILAQPLRHGPSTSAATVLALASAVEIFWEIVIEADILIRAMAMPRTDDTASEAVIEHAIQTQHERLTALIAPHRTGPHTNIEPNTQESSDAG